MTTQYVNEIADQDEVDDLALSARMRKHAVTSASTCDVIELNTGHRVYRHGYFGGSKAEAPIVAKATSGVCVAHAIPYDRGNLPGCGQRFVVTSAQLSRGGGGVQLTLAPAS